jgi:hypothetical protein
MITALLSVESGRRALKCGAHATDDTDPTVKLHACEVFEVVWDLKANLVEGFYSVKV